MSQRAGLIIGKRIIWSSAPLINERHPIQPRATVAHKDQGGMNQSTYTLKGTTLLRQLILAKQEDQQRLSSLILQQEHILMILRGL